MTTTTTTAAAATRNNTDYESNNRTKVTRKQKWKENNCMDISSNKSVKSHTRKLGKEKKTLREKLNIF